MLPRWLKSSPWGASSSSPAPSNGPKKRDNNWVDGFRGIASFMVLTGHLVTSFAQHLHNPAVSEDGPSLVLQWPFLRLVVGGRGAVAIFFIITGYVNALSPIRRLANDDVAVALHNMSRSCFARTGRLVFPTSIAIIITWAATQLGAFKMGWRIDAPWIQRGCFYDDGFWTSLYWLARNLTVFWRTAKSYYDGVHWSLPYFLASAFRVYVVLLVMALVGKKSRYIITGILWAFAWISNDFLIGLNVTFGIFLAQLHTDLGNRTADLLPTPIPHLLMILGLFLWSFPPANPEWAPWSRFLTNLMRVIGPNDNPDPINRYWVSVGVMLVMLGITFSPAAKRVLTSSLFNFLGRCSFAVYLLHNLLARSLLVWMLYGFKAAKTPKYDEKGELVRLTRPGPWMFVLMMPLFYIILYAIAYAWTTYVDAFCVRMVNKLRDLMFRDEEMATLKAQAEMQAQMRAQNQMEMQVQPPAETRVPRQSQDRNQTQDLESMPLVELTPAPSPGPERTTQGADRV